MDFNESSSIGKYCLISVNSKVLGQKSVKFGILNGLTDTIFYKIHFSVKLYSKFDMTQ